MSDNKGDPGWNDPPTFSFEKAAEIQGNAVKKGISLTKRIAFPLSGPGKSSSGGIDPTIPQIPLDLSRTGAPPIGSPPVGLPRISSEITPESDSNTNDQLEDRLSDVLQNFEVVHKLNESGEITKRIKMMEKMWIDGKLDGVVQKRLVELSQVLKNGDVDSADRIQKSLMVDYVAVCSSWMGGVRQLINIQREVQTPEQS